MTEAVRASSVSALTSTPLVQASACVSMSASVLPNVASAPSTSSLWGVSASLRICAINSASSARACSMSPLSKFKASSAVKMSQRCVVALFAILNEPVPVFPLAFATSTGGLAEFSGWMI